MLTPSFLRNLETLLGSRLRKKIHIKRVSPVSGGSINLAAKVETTTGIYFLKVNDAFRYPGMFELEENGLRELRNANSFSIPEVILTGEVETHSFLVMQWIESKPQASDFWSVFGRSLATLHKTTSPKFGFKEDNYIGSLTQSNREHNQWIDFFIEERLEKQVQRAVNSGKLELDDVSLFKKLYMNLDSVLPHENPALLHGDLWNGNFLTGNDGLPCLIDPAVYYGHREMDLSMTKLFGGFDPAFYDAYNETYPVAAGFDERIDIHNLYPLLVHVNLFGGSYISQVRTILKRFR